MEVHFSLQVFMVLIPSKTNKIDLMFSVWTTSPTPPHTKACISRNCNTPMSMSNSYLTQPLMTQSGSTLLKIGKPKWPMAAIL